METVRIPGRPALAATHGGSGELVLFLHGIGGNRSNWIRQLASFAHHYHVSAWDMRGYGDSEAYDGPFAFADVRRDVDRVLDAFGVRAAHLVGLSLGGRVAFGYAFHRPERP